MSNVDKKYKKPHKVPGFPFLVKTPRQKARAIQLVAEMTARKALLGTPLKPTNGYGDPTSPYPGDRPDAYDPTLTQEHFDQRFTGTIDDLKSITFSDMTQIHGKLKEGHTPALGWMVDAAGFVVKAPAST